jgi:hypothetical protein
MADSDRRNSPRLRVAACAALEAVGMRSECDQALGSVLDVSRDGIGIETGQPPRIGQLVRLRIALDDEIEEVLARTARVSRPPRSIFSIVGFVWEPESEAQLAFLEKVFIAAEELHL